MSSCDTCCCRDCRQFYSSDDPITTDRSSRFCHQPDTEQRELSAATWCLAAKCQALDPRYCAERSRVKHVSDQVQRDSCRRKNIAISKRDLSRDPREVRIRRSWKQIINVTNEDTQTFRNCERCAPCRSDLHRVIDPARVIVQLKPWCEVWSIGSHKSHLLSAARPLAERSIFPANGIGQGRIPAVEVIVQTD